MLTQQFLKSRTSTREFKENELSEVALEKLNKFLKEEAITDNSKVRFYIATNGNEVYKGLQGLAGYRGVMIKAPAYVGLNILEDDPRLIIEGSYALEQLITYANELGLGTCWVTLNDVEERVKYPLFDCVAGSLPVMLAIGYPLDDNKREHKYSDRLANSDLVFIDSLGNEASDEELEQRGLSELFDYAKYAPSSYNAQPWRFLIEDDVLSLYIKDFKADENLMDAGIIMYYIDELGKNFSLNTTWDINPKIEGDTYTFIASKNL
ncbi:MAG: nitroreductase family protein [Tissierellia bacterium]|nr:nitroreductase family protein [Tissierellia bacterium]